MVTSALVGSTAFANTEATGGLDSLSEDCHASDPDDYNGEVWSEWTEDGSAGAVGFHEYGEILDVNDYSSDGYRTVAHVFACYEGVVGLRGVQPVLRGRQTAPHLGMQRRGRR